MFNNFLWRFFERCGAQGVSFVVSIILARLLNPDMYGTVALVSVYTTILSVFVDSGLGMALIQKQGADDTDFSTVFYFNLLSSIFIYVFLFVSAPIIASFYNDTSLILIIRILGISIIVNGVKNIQQAYITRNMLFRKFFFATIIGTVISAFLGIILAYSGYGVWAIIIQGLANSTIDMVVLWLIVGWRPKCLFSLVRFKFLYKYGWKLLISALLDTVYNQLRTLIIGKKYSTSDLAYYNRGSNWPNLFVMNINSSLDSVMLPAMSSVQNDIGKVRELTRNSMKICMYIMAPIMVGLAVTAKPLISLLLTDKWLPVVPYMRIFCFSYAFWPLHTINLNAIKALGRSDLFLKLELIKKSFGMIVLIITMNISVMAMAISLIVTSVFSQIVNSWPNRHLLKYGYLKQLKDISGSLALSVFMGVIVASLSFIQLPDLFVLFLQLVCGLFVYFCGSYFLKLEAFEILLNKLRMLFQRDRAQ